MRIRQCPSSWKKSSEDKMWQRSGNLFLAVITNNSHITIVVDKSLLNVICLLKVSRKCRNAIIFILIAYAYINLLVITIFKIGKDSANEPYISLEIDQQFFDYVLFTYESSFTNHGQLNTHNVHYLDRWQSTLTSTNTSTAIKCKCLVWYY